MADLRAACAEAFGRVWVEGEISEVHRSRAGHVYLSLRDDASLLRAVVFRRAAETIEVPLEEGLWVRARAQIDVYPERGQLQLIVDQMVAAGEGALRLAFERLARRLREEGLFDPAHKRPLPIAPRRIGLVTSLGGAAIHDLLRALRARGAALDVVVYDARVQGEDAWREIVRGLHRLAALPDVELIVLTRGGGSIHDLWSFNREEVARAVFELETPVISAIGHETDWVLTDWVADARAATPTAAAALIAPDGAALRQQLATLASRLERAQRARILALSQQLRGLERGLVHPREKLRVATERVRGLRARLLRLGDTSAQRSLERLERAQQRLLTSLARPLDPRRHRLERSTKSLSRGVQRHTQRLRTQVDRLALQLDALSPLGVLSRGYAIARRDPDGAILRSGREVGVGDAIRVELSQGEISATVSSARVGRARRRDRAAGPGPDARIPKTS